MSAIEENPVVDTQGKKRKRTGKEREERKKAAILAQQQAEELQMEAREDDPKEEQKSEEAIQPETVAETARPTVDLDQLSKRVPQALKSLHPAFKQAKTFETRRLIKKIKFLRSKESKDNKEEIENLESQLALIHGISLHSLAQTHLLSKLRKHPRLKQTPLPSSITSQFTLLQSSNEAAGSTSNAAVLTGKAENRLTSAKGVAEKVKSVLAWVTGEEGAKLVADKKGVAKSKPVKKNAQAASDSEDDQGMFDEGLSRQIANGSDEESDSDDELAQQHRAADAAGWESGSVPGGEDSDADSDDSDAIPVRPAKRTKASSPPAKAPKAPKPAKKEKPSKADLASSVFLPSLAVGFTRGDDGDSDPDLDDDPNGVAGREQPVRKNRRGQRARQAIWEKKYGKGAKHVVRQREEEKIEEEKARKRAADRARPRDSGWGNKGGASGSAAPAPVSAAPRAAPSAAAPQAQAGGQNLHPSWEAAKLRKQKMEAVAAAKPSQKIVFD
ncbi:hypothetical protein L202_02892 [Cryptococcus amylolentus CBS 6039]|uniref:Bud22 domain-containing protein n=1 Tax=Cryptococcus amylolentus CBS 6039 TaxID=1295533 RepID=A0A1E3HYU1_9TREE|nr:hypothetical protein L202_02892 [Cryptococcus amylolentus CBS 6039]ODN80731.1 hypothetical protein L202_02892 [Cryptococcus amylolentus CBS 6039]